jgi:type III secretion protein S
MNGDAIRLMNQGLWLVLSLSAPPVLMAALAGLIVAILQAATQLQEQTTQYAVKFAAVVLTLAVAGRMMGSALYSFGDQIFSNFASLVRP